MIHTVISIGRVFGIKSFGIERLLEIVFMGDKFYKNHIFLEDAFPSDPLPMRFLPLLHSAIRQYFWPSPRCGGLRPGGICFGRIIFFGWRGHESERDRTAGRLVYPRGVPAQHLSNRGGRAPYAMDRRRG
jgi:hypothetical protein